MGKYHSLSAVLLQNIFHLDGLSLELWIFKYNLKPLLYMQPFLVKQEYCFDEEKEFKALRSKKNVLLCFLCK